MPLARNIQDIHIKSFYIARHNAWLEMRCPCTHEKIHNVNLHIFHECSHENIVCDQLALSQHLDEILLDLNMEHMSQVGRIQIILGKNCSYLLNIDMEGIYALSAKICYNAYSIMNK